MQTIFGDRVNIAPFLTTNSQEDVTEVNENKKCKGKHVPQIFQTMYFTLMHGFSKQIRSNLVLGLVTIWFIGWMKGTLKEGS